VVLTELAEQVMVQAVVLVLEVVLEHLSQLLLLIMDNLEESMVVVEEVLMMMLVLWVAMVLKVP
jgi:hypothetical protein